MKKNVSKRSNERDGRDRLNQLMDAMALIIARRQMKRYWSTGHRATMPSII